MLEGVSGTQDVNYGLKMPYNRSITVVLADGIAYKVARAEGKLQLLFKLKCTYADRRHYKYCTPRALMKPNDLWCPFCNYDEVAWVAAEKKPITPNELPFMCMLASSGVCGKWCHQARLPFWSGCVDFYNWELRACVQIDGPTHWDGMRVGHHTVASKRDFKCNKAAFDSRVALVRVHEGDIPHRDCVFAAISAAVANHAVVLTAGFRSIGWHHANNWLSYASMLQHRLGSNCCSYSDTYGNTIFHSIATPTM